MLCFVVLLVMNKIKVYVDTSVIGGCFDEEFSKYSNMLVDKFKKRLFIPIVSETVDKEIKNSPDLVEKKYNEILTYNAIYLNITDEVDNLVLEYLNKKIVTKKYEGDCYHIALATINKIDILVSWNFKHIVNNQKIMLFNFVNKSLNYSEIIINDPSDFLGYGKYKLE